MLTRPQGRRPRQGRQKKAKALSGKAKAKAVGLKVKAKNVGLKTKDKADA